MYNPMSNRSKKRTKPLSKGFFNVSNYFTSYFLKKTYQILLIKNNFKKVISLKNSKKHYIIKHNYKKQKEVFNE